MLSLFNSKSSSSTLLEMQKKNTSAHKQHGRSPGFVEHATC